MAILSSVLSYLSKAEVLLALVISIAAFLIYRRQTSAEKGKGRETASSSPNTWDVSPYSEEEDGSAAVTTGPDYEEHADYIPFIPFQMEKHSPADMIERSSAFYRQMNARRSCRFFSDAPVPLEVVQNVVRTAGTSPSGAHTEPWTYVVVSNKEMKSKIREIIEEEEEINYRKRMGDKWVNDLKRLKTTWVKPYLEIAPYIVLVFKQVYGLKPTGEKIVHYYNEQSVSISIGLFLAALQNAGLATVTTTPLNAGPALRDLLQRPVNEKVVILLPVGFPADDATVPDLTRKPLDKIMIHFD